MSSSQDGLVLLDKPSGLTSFQTIGLVKRRLRTKKVGHTGTLDRFAEGLLLALVGSYTRLASLFLVLEKEYAAVIRFGTETDTLDPEGDVCCTAPVPSLSRISSVLSSFEGEIQQVPPVFSAVHHRGRRAYRLAREGKKPVLEPRSVIVRWIRVEDYLGGDLTVRVRCSKGTYIRSIARDLGKASGSCAHLKALKRVAVGPFRLEEAVKPALLDPVLHIRQGAEAMKSIPGISVEKVKPSFVSLVKHGAAMEDVFFQHPKKTDGVCAVLDGGGELIAVVRRESGCYKYLTVLV